MIPTEFPKNYKLRAATLADLDTLVRHRRRMWEDMGGYSSQQLDDADPVYRRWAYSRLKTGTLLGFIIEDGDGHPAASGCLWLQEVHPRPCDPGQREPAREQPYLLSMFTEPPARGRGLAREIVRAAKRIAIERGYPRMSLHAAPAGRGIYEKEGFRQTAEMRISLLT